MSMNMDTPYRWAGTAGTAGAASTTGGQAAADASAQATVDVAEREARKAAIRKRLAEIDAQLAKHNQYSVAAEAARIGDMSPYMQLLSMQQNAGAANRATAQGIENTLYQAEGLTGGLKSAASEDREQFLVKIKTLQNQARDRARAAGMSDADFEKLPVNQRVNEAIKQYEGDIKADETYLAFETDIVKKAQDKALRNADLENLRAKADEYGNNSKVGRQLLDLIDKYKNETVEANSANEKRKKDALVLKAALEDLPTEERRTRVRNLTRYERSVLEKYSPETLKVLRME